MAEPVPAHPHADDTDQLARRAAHIGADGEAVAVPTDVTDPEEVAALAAFIASEQASFVTGENIGVSGGMGCGVA